MKKTYTRPTMQTENVVIGVYGNYLGDDICTSDDGCVDDTAG